MITPKQVIDFHENISLTDEDKQLIATLTTSKEFKDFVELLTMIYGLMLLVDPQLGMFVCYLSAFTKGIKFGKQLAEVEQLERI